MTDNTYHCRYAQIDSRSAATEFIVEIGAATEKDGGRGRGRGRGMGNGDAGWRVDSTKLGLANLLLYVPSSVVVNGHLPRFPDTHISLAPHSASSKLIIKLIIKLM